MISDHPMSFGKIVPLAKLSTFNVKFSERINKLPHLHDEMDEGVLYLTTYWYTLQKAYISINSKSKCHRRYTVH